jgi:Ni/Co efflux regulator RcnB
MLTLAPTTLCKAGAEVTSAKELAMGNFYTKRLALAALAGLGTALIPPAIADAQVVARAPVYRDRTVVVHRGPVSTRAVVIDRGRPGWWRGNPVFVGYAGPRPGYYFAPGHGYYVIPPGYYGRPFVAGVVIPPPMRRYVVVQPALYGLAPPPPGYAWYYAGTSLVLAAVATGMIVQSVAGGW